MSDRNWEAELAKIDKQLASVSDEALLAESKAAAAPRAAGRLQAAGAAAPPRSSGSAPASASALPLAQGRGAWRGWVSVTIAIGAAAGLPFWPWPATCGAPLLGYTAATGAVAVLGVWSAVGSWRHRLGLAHVTSLLVVVWGLSLGAREVLPRIGYAKPTAERGANWSCPAPSETPSGPPSAVPATR